ncbi:MAG: MOSC domain-containing protein [Candidatus Binatia bacterium]
MRVGTVKEIWRYPVKSMLGERVAAAMLGALGLPGDRGYALRDDDAGEIRGAKKFPALMQCEARYLGEPGEGIPPAEVRLPSGETLRTDDPSLSQKLSALLGKRVSLWSRRPAEDVEHYRRRPDNNDLQGDLQQMFARIGDEPLPDFSLFPQELFEYTSPRGTYFDAFPIHFVTTAWLGELASRNTKARWDVRRFRPNFLIDAASGVTGFAEGDWVGREVRVGRARLKVEVGCPRCVMTTQQTADLPKDPSVLRTIVGEANQNVGVYASVVGSGEVREGDPVELA